MAKNRFSVRGVSLNGEWDDEAKVLLVRDLSGEVGIKGNVLGFDVDVIGDVGAAFDNCLRFRVKAIGKMPKMFHEMLLKVVTRFNKQLAKATKVTKDTVLIDPNKLMVEHGEIRILIQPTDLEAVEEVELGWREKVLDWTRRNAGSLAKDVVDYILTIPDMLGLLKRLMMDARIPGRVKAKIALSIAYVLSPIDVIPEAFAGPLGLVDDAYVLLMLVNDLATEIPEEIIREHWHGRPEVIEVLIQGQALAKFVATLPDGALKKILALFGRKNEEAGGRE